MKQFSIKNFATAAVATEINTIGFVELMKQAGANGLMPQETQYGTKIFLTKDGERVLIDGKPACAIRLGSKVQLTEDLFAEDNLPAIKELVNNNIIYWGVAEHEEEGIKRQQHWLCFSRKGTLVPGKVVSLDDIIKATGMSKKDFALTP